MPYLWNSGSLSTTIRVITLARSGMILNDYLEIGERQFTEAGVFFGHGTDNAWDEAVMLAFYVLDLPPDCDRSVLDVEVTAGQGDAITALYKRRVKERIPAPYLTGWSWFCRMPFKVDQRVLIPRSPVGELIERGFEPWLEAPPLSVLDLCCGCGCIGIATAHRFPEARVVLADISNDALDVARENVALHELGKRVTVVRSDALDNIEECFDLILCNPPYVNAEDLRTMPEEYRHEPALALGSGDDGLTFTRRLLAGAAGHLTERGLLCGEVGNSWPAFVAEFAFEEVELERGGRGVYCLERRRLETDSRFRTT